MCGAPPIDGTTIKNADPLENPKRIAVDGEGVAPEAIQKNASCSFPGKAGKLRQNSLGGVIGHLPKDVERQVARGLPNPSKEAFDDAGFLPVKPTFAQDGRDLCHGSAVECRRQRVHGVKARPDTPRPGEICLKGQDDVDRFVEWVVLVPQL